MWKALVMGLNNYPDCELNWRDNAVIAMKELLESNGDGPRDFDVMPIIDSCTKEQLRAAIEQLFMDNNDIVFCIFRGMEQILIEVIFAQQTFRKVIME